MFQSKKTKTEYLNPEGVFKDWKDSWPEIESLGLRLDRAREVVQTCEPGTWAHEHWSTVEQNLFRKWQLMVSLYQGGLRQRGPERGIDIDYNWWEGSDEVVSPLPIPQFMTFNWINGWFNQNNLNWSWERARDEKLQKARQGLA